jgi:hypothetical protein
MKVIGKKLMRIDTQEGNKDYLYFYKKSCWEHIVTGDYNTIHKTFSDTFRYIVVMDYPDSIEQIFALEDDDLVIIYSEQCCDGLFNTDGLAYMRLVKKDNPEKTVAMWCLENSPFDYDIAETGSENEQMTPEGLMQHLNHCLKHYHLPEDATPENSKFVRML